MSRFKRGKPTKFKRRCKCTTFDNTPSKNTTAVRDARSNNGNGNTMAAARLARNNNGNGKLTKRQAKFIDEYLVDLNATQAAIRAGYSKRTADVIGIENLGKPKIASAIQRRRDELKASTQMDQEWVLKRYKMLTDYCIDDFFYDDGSMKPFSEIPRDKLYAIGGFKQSKRTLTTKDKTFITNTIKEFVLPKKESVLDSIGKHLGMFERDNEQRRPTANVINPIQINVTLET